MKANKKVDAMVELANNLTGEPAPFDAVSQAHFLAIELCGYHKAHDRIIELELEIENTRATRGERKVNIDKILVEMFNNNVTMIRGTGVTKCPIRIELTKTLDKEGIAEKTRNNILTAISYSLYKKKLYNIHWENELKAEREAVIKQLESEYLTQCIARKQDKGDAGVDAYFIAMNTNLNEKALIEQWEDKEKKFWVDAHKRIQADTLEKIKTVTQTSETPATPASETPASETPASETPASETPAAPASETPAAPASETPAAPASETPAAPLSVAELKTNLNLILPNMILSAKNTRKNCKNEFNNSVLDELIGFLNEVSDCVDNLGSGK